MILLRHGKPKSNKHCYGFSNPPLLEAPRETAARIAPSLPPFRRIISSPSPRCIQLAEALHEGLQGDGPLLSNDALKELNFGDWEGLPWSDVPRKELDTWALTPLDFTIPGGESPRQLEHRVRNWFEEFCPDSEDLIVAHAGSLRVLAACILGKEFDITWQWPLPYATPVQVLHGQKGFVAY